MSRVGCRGALSRILAALARDLWPVAIKTNRFNFRNRQRMGQALLCNQHTSLRIFEYERYALRRIRRFQRYICAARLQNGYQANDHLQRTFDTDRYAHFRFKTEPAQMMGQLVGATVKLLVSQLLVTKLHGNSFWRPRDLGLKEIVNGPDWHLSACLIPLDYQLFALVFGQQWKFRDPLLRMRHRCFQKQMVVSKQSLDCRFVK